MTTVPTGLLIIRAWAEPGSTHPLRAHISRTTDVGLGVQREHTLADVDAVCAEVQQWLNEMATNRP